MEQTNLEFNNSYEYLFDKNRQIAPTNFCSYSKEN